MLKRYEKFLNEFDKIIEKYFNSHSNFICCQKGCSSCCEIGEYPFSRLEAEYIMRGFLELNTNYQNQVRKNILTLVNNNKFSDYSCPFLINKECSVYKYRGIVCRTHGLAYLDNGIVKLPECVKQGLNYSKNYDAAKKELLLDNPVKQNLRTDRVFNSEIAHKYDLECGEIRPIIKWFL